jgi:hypothetical protein
MGGLACFCAVAEGRENFLFVYWAVFEWMIKCWAMVLPLGGWFRGLLV